MKILKLLKPKDKNKIIEFNNIMELKGDTDRQVSAKCIKDLMSWFNKLG